jgi:hypothetical protein
MAEGIYTAFRGTSRDVSAIVRRSALVTEGNVNEALRNALRNSNLNPPDLAARLSVDPKTVDKWLAGRVPHPRTRAAVATLLGLPESELWPRLAVSNGQGSGSEGIRAVYPHRWAVPRNVWLQLFRQAEHQIDILVYSGLFLAEDTGILHLLVRKAEAGVSTRLLLGDPDAPEVAQRSVEEGTSGALGARICNALVLFQPLLEASGVEVRLHRTILYNSIFRADNDLLVNMHIYGIPASLAPVLHLKSTLKDNEAATYVESFEQVWKKSNRYTKR